MTKIKFKFPFTFHKKSESKFTFPQIKAKKRKRNPQKPLLPAPFPSTLAVQCRCRRPLMPDSKEEEEEEEMKEKRKEKPTFTGELRRHRRSRHCPHRRRSPSRRKKGVITPHHQKPRWDHAATPSGRSPNERDPRRRKGGGEVEESGAGKRGGSVLSTDPVCWPPLQEALSLAALNTGD